MKSDVFNKTQDLILCFIPEAGVFVHFAAVCMVAAVLRDKGYQSVFVQCRGSFPRCPVMDMHGLDYSSGIEQKQHICQDCLLKSSDVYYQMHLNTIFLDEYIRPAMLNLIQRAIQEAPRDLIDFEYDGVKFGKIGFVDLGLALKQTNVSVVQQEYYKPWLNYIITSMLSYLAVLEMSKTLPIKRLLHYNEYSSSQGAIAAAKKLNVPSLMLSHASHHGVDRRRYAFLRVSAPVQQQLNMQHWPRWRDLPLSRQQVFEITADIFSRFSAVSAHVYSPPKSLSCDDLLNKLALYKGRKTLVAFTSSLDERIFSRMMLETAETMETTWPQAFANQIEWLAQLIDWVEHSNDLQLIVRIHPREGKNKREGRYSEHLSQLLAAFQHGKYPHCRFIWPEEPISSYDLFEIADLGLTAWSTVGLEMARLGVPVLVAWQRYSFPDDDFLVWGGKTPERYFASLRQLLARESSLKTIVHAYRCYNFFQLGSSLNMEDVVPAHNFQSLPPYSLPREAEAIESVVIEGRDTYDINLQRLLSQNSPGAAQAEEAALCRALRMIIHFMFTGARLNEDIDLYLCSSEGSEVERIVRSFQKREVKGNLLLRTGSEVTYITEDRVLSRYSPMLARLAGLAYNRVFKADAVGKANSE